MWSTSCSHSDLVETGTAEDLRNFSGHLLDRGAQLGHEHSNKFLLENFGIDYPAGTRSTRASADSSTR
jgi:hypothetical protein